MIDDAKNVSAKNISDQLWAINTGSPNIIWEDTEGESRIKVVAWMTNESYQDYYEKSFKEQIVVTGPPTPTVWVTLAPQIVEFCQQLKSSISDDVRDRFDPSFRLKQFMGLNPHYRYDRFVELWVDSDDVFRPCPDPQTDDHSCNISIDPNNPPRIKGMEGEGEYAAFFDDLVGKQYQPGPFAAPWTRLGYTYDWVRGVRNVGASEFMLVSNAEYQVDGSYSTAEYCAVK